LLIFITTNTVIIAKDTKKSAKLFYCFDLNKQNEEWRKRFKAYTRVCPKKIKYNIIASKITETTTS